MRAFLFTMSFAMVNCASPLWRSLYTFQETFVKEKVAAENVIVSVNETLHNRTEDSFGFIEAIKNSKFVKARFSNTSDNLKCESKFQNFISNFRKAYNRLEFPVLRRIADLKQRLSGISSTIAYHQGLAESKYWSCELSKAGHCTDVVEQWLEQKLISLSCEIVECESHVLRKRYWLYNNYNECLGLFTCSNANCLSRGKICDGYDDCGDNSDEFNCPTKFYSSPENCSQEFGTYLCGNKECLPLSKVCDGIYDCKDYSDEYNCPKNVTYGPNNCSLELGTYLCDNKECVSLSSVCDGIDDCGDGTDEGGNCTGNCQEDCHPRGVCLRSPKGDDCVTACPEGLFETASGCKRNIEPDLLPISQLLLDLERLIVRHSAAYHLLKARAISEIVLSFTKDCGDHNYSMLDKITKIKIETSNQKATNSSSLG